MKDITDIPVLDCVISMFNKLNFNEINYCLFKSNESSKKDLTGESDIDVIFDFSLFRIIFIKCS